MGLLDEILSASQQVPKKLSRLASLLGDSASVGAQAYSSANGPLAPQHANTLAGLLADFTPVVGDAKSAYDGVQSFKEGDYLGAALGGLGALPMVPNLAGMFAGKGAKIADLAKQGAAESMLKAGRDPAEVWKLTGWGKGPDGHWRFEIPDNNSEIISSHPMSYLSDLNPFGKPMPLAESENAAKLFNREIDNVAQSRTADRTVKGTLKHDLLKDAYPETQGYKVQFRQLDGPFDGSYGNGMIELGMGNLGNKTVGKKNLLHELQHSIQDIEGFSSGGDPAALAKKFGLSKEDAKKMYDRLAGEAESRMTAFRSDMTPMQRAESYPFSPENFRAQTGDVYGRSGINLSDVILGEY